jgi:Zn-dependent protease with chaperone function
MGGLLIFAAIFGFGGAIAAHYVAQPTSRSQTEAVLGHEISHVANGDMVTLALVQGVLNTFVIFLARIIGSIVDRSPPLDEQIAALQLQESR